MKPFFLFPLLFLVGCSSSQTEPELRETSIPKQAINRGSTLELESNMNQVRQFVGMYRQENEGKIPTLAELKAMRGFVPSMLINPVDKKPLVYDEKTGEISVEGAPSSRTSKSSVVNNSDSAPTPADDAPLPQ